MSRNLPSPRYWGMLASSPRIAWQGCDPERLVLEFYGQEHSTWVNSSLHRRLIREMHHLLYSLFSPHAQEILVEALSHGFSGARVVKAQPFYPQGGGQQIVVKFGNMHTIKQEYENYRKYVRDFLGGGCAVALEFQRTDHLGAISYTFLGAPTHQMQEFGVFYQQSSAGQVKQVLDMLFRHTCGLWYASHTLQLLNVTETYQQQFGYSLKQIEQKAVARSLQVSWQGELRFQSLQTSSSRDFADPFDGLKAVEPIIRPAYVGITHGDLNARNILVDRTERPWLIDFQSTEPSHILRDVAMLDSVIRLQLLRSEQATLEERLTLEEALCNITHFDQLDSLQNSYSTCNPALVKAWAVLIHLRVLARWMLDKNPYGDLSEYSFAVLYCTINALRFDSLEDVQYEHALLSASLLSKALGLT